MITVLRLTYSAINNSGLRQREQSLRHEIYIDSQRPVMIPINNASWFNRKRCSLNLSIYFLFASHCLYFINSSYLLQIVKAFYDCYSCCVSSMVQYEGIWEMYVKIYRVIHWNSKYYATKLHPLYLIRTQITFNISLWNLRLDRGLQCILI